MGRDKITEKEKYTFSVWWMLLLPRHEHSDVEIAEDVSIDMAQLRGQIGLFTFSVSKTYVRRPPEVH